MKIVITATFHNDGDFTFIDGLTLIDPKSKLYEGSHIDYRYSEESEVQNFYLSADGGDGCRLAARDLLDNMICGLRVSKAYLVGDIYEMLNPLLDEGVFNREKDLILNKSMSGNYDGTTVQLIVIQADMSGRRTRLEIEAEYNELAKDTTLVETGPRSHGYANQNRRNELLAEYRSTLTEEAQLAIFLHQHLCHSNHTDGCSWSYEISGVHDDWNGYAHKEYLDMAKRMMEKCPDVETIKSIILAMSNTAN